MKITNYEHTGLNKIESWIEKNQIKRLDERSLKEALKTINISFIAEEINRIQSMLLCEIRASYVQQSQRYVTMHRKAYLLPQLEDNDYNYAKKLTENSFGLYERMSKLKNGEFRGRPKLENYLHLITIEDARYILPTSTKTNICVTMTGDKLYELFRLFNDKKYKYVFEDIRREISLYLPGNLIKLLPRTYNSDNNKDLIESLYHDDLFKIESENNLILLSQFKNLDLQVGLGALTSTQSRTPSETLIIWGDEANDKSKAVVQRVLGYGHESIAELARTTFGIMCSIVTYHQQIRHRLPEIFRENLLNLILDKNRPVVVPQMVKNSIFYDEFLQLTEEFKAFRLYVYEKYGQDKAFFFLLNCDQIKMVISTNARIDTTVLSERTCMNAQWEIRELAIKKLRILRKLSSILYEKALPSCMTSKCKEGKLTCGRQHEVESWFAKKNQ